MFVLSIWMILKRHVMTRRAVDLLVERGRRRGDLEGLGWNPEDCRNDRVLGFC